MRNDYSLYHAFTLPHEVLDDEFRAVASCTSRESADAAARLLGIVPFWQKSQEERTAEIRRMDEATARAIQSWVWP